MKESWIMGNSESKTLTPSKPWKSSPKSHKTKLYNSKYVKMIQTLKIKYYISPTLQYHGKDFAIVNKIFHQIPKLLTWTRGYKCERGDKMSSGFMIAAPSSRPRWTMRATIQPRLLSMRTRPDTRIHDEQKPQGFTNASFSSQMRNEETHVLAKTLCDRDPFFVIAKKDTRRIEIKSSNIWRKSETHLKHTRSPRDLSQLH